MMRSRVGTTAASVVFDPNAPASCRVRATDSVLDHAKRAIEIEDIEGDISTLLGGGHFYFALTRGGGAVDEAMIKAYIESQKWDDDDQGFKITAPTEP